MRRHTFMFLIAAGFSLAACDDHTGPDDGSVRLAFDLNTGAQEWEAGFADYPVDGEEDHELESDHKALPAPLDPARKGIYISGNNHSDDLLMFLSRRVEDLEPGMRYRVLIEVQLATNAPQGCAGVGGAPGESVYVKAGASSAEPELVVGENDHYELDVDLGEQAADGTAGIVLGNIANSNTDCLDPVYEMKTLASGNKVLTADADEEGNLWLIVGTDSGHESTTSLWYARIDVRLVPQEASTLR